VRSFSLLPVFTLLFALGAEAQGEIESTEGVRLLVLDIVARDGAAADDAKAVDGLVTDGLRGRERLLVAGNKDVRRRAPMQADRLGNCEDVLCLFELSDALAADFVLFGHIQPQDAGIAITLGVFDAREGEIVGLEEIEGADLRETSSRVQAAMDKLMAPVFAAAVPNLFEDNLFLLGAGITSIGVLATAGAASWALELESHLADPDIHRDRKAAALELGPIALWLAAGGLAVTAAGAAVLVAGVLVE
jgi:hypothetical protein